MMQVDCCHQPSAISHQSSVISHQSSVISHQPSAITGAGAWRLDQIASTPATIRIDGAINVSGDATFLRGTFDVDDSFCTTGTLEFGKVGGTPVIDVASQKRFKAHQSSCP